MRQEKLEPSFFQSSDVVGLSKKLIGCKLSTFIDNRLTSGLITETEAYAGQGDKACHAHLGRFTKRTSVMYEPGGIAYIYLCYGIHHLFNIVTNAKDHADAILIRAIEPIDGIDIMLKRRQKTKLDKSLTSGPGNLTKAFGLTKDHNARSVCSERIWLEDKTTEINNIIETTRIGIDYAEEDALLPWRFYNADSQFISVR